MAPKQFVNRTIQSYEHWTDSQRFVSNSSKGGSFKFVSNRVNEERSVHSWMSDFLWGANRILVFPNTRSLSAGVRLLSDHVTMGLPWVWLSSRSLNCRQFFGARVLRSPVVELQDQSKMPIQALQTGFFGGTALRYGGGFRTVGLFLG